MASKRKQSKSGIAAKASAKWKSLHDHHLTIFTTAFVLTLGMMVFTFSFALLGLYDEWSKEMNALAWGSGIMGGFVAIFLWPEFFFLFGRYNSLREYLELESPSELRRAIADAEEAAKLLGPRYEQKLREHLSDKGVRTKRRSK